jgi:hypothetical protein
MIKILNCVNYEPINSFTRIYPSETSVESLFSLYLGIPFIGCTQDIRRELEEWYVAQNLDP